MLKNISHICFFVFLLLCVCALSWADIVVLKEGQCLTGNILTEKENQLIIDVGAAVLNIPKEKILEYQYSDTNEAVDIDINGLGVNAGELTLRRDVSSRLYHTANLKKTTIEKCVEAFSEAVVKVSSPAGVGSGFFINEEGYLITNYHVIEKETKIEVTLFQKVKDGFEKKSFKNVKIEAINPFVDMALLKVEELRDTKVKYAYLGDVDKIKVGEKVFAIGNPLGLERTVTDGVISATNRAFEGVVYIQTSADINPGNSGGPLFNLAGEVIGVANMGYIFFGGLGFAIPIDYVKHFIENRDAFIYDKDNPNTGFRYLQPDPKRNKAEPNFFDPLGNNLEKHLPANEVSPKAEQTHNMVRDKVVPG